MLMPILSHFAGDLLELQTPLLFENHWVKIFQALTLVILQQLRVKDRTCVIERQCVRRCPVALSAGDSDRSCQSCLFPHKVRNKRV